MSCAEGWRRLAAELRGDPPAGLANALSDEELATLAEAVRQARQQEAAELRRAGEQSLSHIPRLLRGPVRRIVGG